MSLPHIRPFYAAYGFGPYECFFCRTPVTYDEVLIHHVDEELTHNHPYNLAPAHRPCYTGYHAKRRDNAAWIAAGAAANRGRMHTPEEVEKRIAPIRGRPKAPEHREKIGAAHRGMKREPEARARMSASAKRRCADPEQRAEMARRGATGRESRWGGSANV